MKRKKIVKLINLCCGIVPNSALRKKIKQKILVRFGLTDYLYNRKMYNIGEFSYIGKNTVIANKKETVIGKYCSIARDVSLGLTQHPTDTLTTHGFICHKTGIEVPVIDGLLCAQNDNVVDFSNKLMPPVIIGNDVWIGYRAIVMDGVKIGDGAIIAAGAIVTRDVEPYTIVAGIPAKPIRKRFSHLRGGGRSALVYSSSSGGIILQNLYKHFRLPMLKSA